MKRETLIDKHNYKEVTLNYRIFRANQIEEKKVSQKEDRIVCPFVEAGRSKEAYGQYFIPGLEGKDITAFSNALNIPPYMVKTIAYFSGKKSNVFRNIIFGKFDDMEIKNGLIHTLKNGINTGIYKDQKFSQKGFNQFVWDLFPKLKDIEMNNEWLFSHKANEIYLKDSQIDEVLAHNEKNRITAKKSLGKKLSGFEMSKLLLGLLSQDLKNNPLGKRGILIRDIHDLYKYGFLPAIIEEKLMASNLIPEM